jgi:uracil-DNA glycosylase
MEGGGAHADPRAELAELAASVRAHLEWQADTGAVGLPPSETSSRAVATGPRAAKDPAPRHVDPAAHAPAPRQVDRHVDPAPRHVDPAAGHADPAPRAPAAGHVDPPPRATQPAAPRAPVAAPATPDERLTRLALVAEEVRGCTRCVLHEQREQTVFARGNPFAELCFVGEGPGADEDRYGEPFVGAAGQLLDRMIAAMGYRRDDVYVCNVVKCRPPNNRKPEPMEMASCMPFAAEQLALVQPKVIVALGATAVQGLIGASGGITRMRGKWKLYKGSIPVMPTFHPAYLLRNPAAKRDVWNDLQDVMRHLGKAPPGK